MNSHFSKRWYLQALKTYLHATVTLEEKLAKQLFTQHDYISKLFSDAHLHVTAVYK